MPTPADNLNPNSTEEEIKAAISNTIAQLIREGRDKDQAVAMAFDMAKRKTGKNMQHYSS